MKTLQQSSLIGSMLLASAAQSWGQVVPVRPGPPSGSPLPGPAPIPPLGGDNSLALLLFGGLVFLILIVSGLTGTLGFGLGSIFDDKFGSRNREPFAKLGAVPGLVSPSLLLLYFAPNAFNICAVVLAGVIVGGFALSQWKWIIGSS
jgi:hypothetical protein